MWYLFLQVWFLLLIAFVLGWLAHWFFCCRNKEQVVEPISTTSAVTASAVTNVVDEPAPIEISDEWKPQGFASRPDQVDDLKRIKGIGGVIEKTLHELGVYQFSQVAEWSNDNVAWVENFIAFPGRIDREGWINQAKTLNMGGTTEFANRVDKGDVEY
ncbi:MAG: hypothetical protein KTR16_06150 [Acidiferrobacterales bacterium]|nr:hypothetical protein [Acidiferrobacterales bacterium]